MWDAIANEVGGWLLAAFGVKKGSQRERKKRNRKAQKLPFARRHRK